MKEKIQSLIDASQVALKKGNELEVIEILEEAKELAKNYNENILLITILNDISGAKRVCGRYDEAIKELNEAISLMKSLGFDQRPEFGTTLINIANTYRMKKEFNRAIEYFEAAYQLFTDIGQDGFLWASLCNNYSLLLQEIGDFEKAYIMQQQSIDTLKKTKRFELPLASSYNNMYKILCDLNRIDEGEAYLMDAKNIYERLVGTNHPLYAASINNLADCYYRKKEMEKALSLYEEALKIIDENYGKNSEAYQNILQNIETIKKKSNISNLNNNFSNDVSKNSSLKNEFKNSQIRKTGIERSRELFETLVEPTLKREMPELLDIASIGIAGQGSECLGYDDDLSEDHDFKTRCTIWLDKPDYEDYFDKIQRIFQNIDAEIKCECAQDFYQKYTGLSSPPTTISQWLVLPQDLLRIVSNGELFINHCKAFKEFREVILNYYPDDVRFKKMAYCLNKIAQSGQYNYARAIKRGDDVVAMFSMSEFIEFHIKFLHLVNRKYSPFYKWRYRSAKELKILAPQTLHLIEKLASYKLSPKENTDIIEHICSLIVGYLNEQGYSDKNYDFLTYQANEIMKNIKNITLRNEDSWIERSKDE